MEVCGSGSQHHQLCRSQGSPLCQSSVVLAPFSPKTTWSSLFSFKTTWSSLPSPPKPCDPPLGMAAVPGFKSQLQSSSAAPFPTPPTISYTCQHSLSFQLYWAAIVNLGRCGPMARSQSSPSSHTALQPGVASHLHHGLKSLPSPWLKARPQLFNISMKLVKGYRYVK